MSGNHGPQNGWLEWKNAVLQDLKELKEGHEGMRVELMKLRLNLEVHKTKVMTWAALIGGSCGFVCSALVTVAIKYLL